MTLETFAIILLVGLIAGGMAHFIVRRGGFGLIGDIVVGVLGAIVTGFMLPTIGLSLGGGLVGVTITAAIGAVAALTVFRKLKRA